MNKGGGRGPIAEPVWSGGCSPTAHYMTEEDTLWLVLTEEERGSCLAAYIRSPLLPTAHCIYAELLHLEW